MLRPEPGRRQLKRRVPTIGARIDGFRRLVQGEFFVFFIMRCVCAVFSYGLYLLLLLITSYSVAYAMAYVAGIALGYLVNSRYVFRVEMNLRSAILFPLVYIFQFVLTFVLLQLAVRWAGIPPWIAFVVAIGITIPPVFLLSRLVLTANQEGPQSTQPH